MSEIGIQKYIFTLLFKEENRLHFKEILDDLKIKYRITKSTSLKRTNWRTARAETYHKSLADKVEVYFQEEEMPYRMERRVATYK